MPELQAKPASPDSSRAMASSRTARVGLFVRA